MTTLLLLIYFRSRWFDCNFPNKKNVNAQQFAWEIKMLLTLRNRSLWNARTKILGKFRQSSVDFVSKMIVLRFIDIKLWIKCCPPKLDWDSNRPKSPKMEPCSGWGQAVPRISAEGHGRTCFAPGLVNCDGLGWVNLVKTLISLLRNYFVQDL